MRRPTVRRSLLGRLGLLGVLAFSTVGCGGATAITRTQDGVTVDADVPVHVQAGAVKPALLHLYQGHVVTFVNDDRVARTIGADPTKNDLAGCSVVGVGPLQPGEQRSVALPFFAACYYRDEQRPGDTAFQGTVVTHDK